MKNETQHAKSIEDVLGKTEQAIFNTKTHRMKSSIALTCETGKRGAIEPNNTNIFLTQNKGKGPPGRQRSPGEVKPNRFSKPVRFVQTNAINSDSHSLTSIFRFSNCATDGFETIKNNKYDDYKFYKFNFIQLLNSIFMKKQILFLAVFVLAVFAGINNSYGQAVAGSAPQTITCAATADAYHPIAGVPYDYKAEISPTGGVPYWFATTSTTYITAGSIVATQEAIGGTYVGAATGYQGTAVAAASPTSVNITWKSEGIAAATVATTDPPKLFVAINYNGTTCADNFKVYPIRPINAFVVDIKNMTPGTTQTPSGYGVKEVQCFDKVQSAVYKSGTDGDIDYDFGKQYLYYEIVAANFTTSYTPTLRLSGMDADQTADIDWGYANGTYDKNLQSGVANGDYAFAANSVVTSATDTHLGVSIYVRLTIHNNDFEGTAVTPITLAVEAVNSASQPDVDNDDCSKNTAFSDTAVQDLNPRPTVQSVAPNTFLPVGNY